MKKLIFLPIVVVLLLPLFILNSCPEVIAGTAPRGVYVGLISFDNNNTTPYRDLVQLASAGNTFSNSSLVWLGAQDNLQTLNNVINSQYNTSTSSSDTGNSKIYYTVNRAIRELKRSESYLSDRLDNVTFVTFTRGQDQGSADVPGSGVGPGTSGEEYGRSIQVQIRGSNQATGTGQTTIRGKPINAYAVAIENTNPLQEETLKNITSGSSIDDKDYQFTLTNYNELDAIFRDIASSLTSVSYRSSLTLGIEGISTPLGGDKFRATFDTFSGNNPESSGSWIEGNVVWTGDRYEILPVQGQTLISSSPNISFNPPLQKALQTGRNGTTRYYFGFPGMTADGNFNVNNIRQFNYQSGVWQELDGAGSWGSTRGQTEQKAAIIFLILDSTLQSSEINSVKSAAQGFITTLYNMSRVQQ